MPAVSRLRDALERPRYEVYPSAGLVAEVAERGAGPGPRKRVVSEPGEAVTAERPSA